jgi:hypothetical protein
VLSAFSNQKRVKLVNGSIPSREPVTPRSPHLSDDESDVEDDDAEENEDDDDDVDLLDDLDDDMNDDWG